MIVFAALTYIVFLIATGFFRNPRQTLFFTFGFLLVSLPLFQLLFLMNVPIRGFLHFQQLCVLGGVVVSATFYLLLAVLRLRPASVVQQINVAGNLFLLFLYSTMFSGVIVNSHFDYNSARAEIVVAQGKEVIGAQGRELYLVTLAPWRVDGSQEAIPVAKGDFERTVAGQSRFLVQVKPGRLGLEWIESYEFLEG